MGLWDVCAPPQVPRSTKRPHAKQDRVQPEGEQQVHRQSTGERDRVVPCARWSQRQAAQEASGGAAQVTQVSSFKDKMQLEDPRFLDIVPEPWWQMGEKMPTAVMTTLFPSVILQQQVNSVSTRHIQPDGHGAFDFVWTHFGFEDDTPEMTERRLRQSNLFGPAGFVSADDGEVIEFSQQAFETKPEHRMLVELGGRDVGETDHMVTETLIRGMYEYWRKVMEA